MRPFRDTRRHKNPEKRPLERESSWSSTDSDLSDDESAMESTASLSPSPSHYITLLEFLQELSELSSTVTDLEVIPWTESHISALIDYVLKLNNAECFYFSSTWRYTSITSLGKDKNRKLSKTKIVALFTQELRRLFQLPKLQKLSDSGSTISKKIQLVAIFINFLVHSLYHRTKSMKLFDDEIDILTKELRFLVTVLGDTPFTDGAAGSGSELEQVHDLLEEFESVANDAAGLVYSLTFIPECIVGIHKPFDALFKRVEILKANIIEFLNLLPFMASDELIFLGDASVDSHFIVDSLLYDLEELMNRDDCPTVNLTDQIRILHQQLMLSKSLLKSIKVPPHDSLKIEESRALIRRLAFEAEYLINCFLARDAPRWYVTIRLTFIILRNEIIRTGIEEFKRNNDLAVLGVAEDFSSHISLQTKRITEFDDIVVGFEKRGRHILEQLVGGRDQLQLISIYGMPGLGKTTFAKKMYNHPSVNDRFDRRSWCFVSQKFQRKCLLTEILIGLTTTELDKDTISNMDEESLVLHVYQSLKGRRYLIVMDDIWDLKAWDDVLRCFPDDGNGSRILFTNRNKDVAPPNSLIYPLPRLSDNQCWELLEKKVFHGERCPLELKGIGRQIAENCHGLPLAVVVIAGTLSNMDREESTWKDVGKDIGSYLFDGGDNSMMQIVGLSYKHLPGYLKPCFLYFRVYRDYKTICVGKLIRLWIAEGFIHKEEGKSAESVAEQYLTELIEKSLVIVSKRRRDGGVKACMIHDVLYEFCRDMCEQENFLKFAFVRNDYPIRVRGPFRWHARSFHCLPTWEEQIYVGNMGQLRVLDFELRPPRSVIGVEYLVQLRYLEITDLPESIASLVNLECLIVMNETKVAIPSVVLKMKRLKHLLFASKSVFNRDTNRPEVNNIEFIRNVAIRSLEDEEILKCSPRLRELKCQCKQFYDEEKGAYRYPDFRFFTELESLNLMSTDEKRECAGISLPYNIKELSLTDFRLPWETSSSVIGRLQNLEVLELIYRAFVGRTWETREGEFQRLRVLKIHHLDLVQWDVESSDHFPRLRQLVLRDCSSLEEIPREIGELATLQLIELRGACTKSLVESAREIEETQRDYGNEELRLVVTAHILEPWPF